MKERSLGWTDGEIEQVSSLVENWGPAVFAQKEPKEKLKESVQETLCRRIEYLLCRKWSQSESVLTG